MDYNASSNYSLQKTHPTQHVMQGYLRNNIWKWFILGCGASKKKAKHEAAKNILTKLKAAQKYVNTSSADIISQSENADDPHKSHPAVQGNSVTSAVVSVQLPNLETDLMSPYDDGISGNPVGELQVKQYITNAKEI